MVSASDNTPSDLPASQPLVPPAAPVFDAGAAAPVPPSPPPTPPVSPPPAPSPAVHAVVTPGARGQIWVLGAVALTALSVVSLALVWTTQQRVKSLEQELVRRQQSSQDQSTEARLMARQAQEASAEVVAKQALLEARVAESALQRTQVEELIQSLSRSRDENVLSDVEAGLRVAQQQAAITGSPEPTVAALKQVEERLARYNQPRLERVRRAVARDLDRARSVAAADLPGLSIRLDEAVRLVDELPLLTTPERRPLPAPKPVAATAAKSASSADAAPQGMVASWLGAASAFWDRVSADVWQEARSLVRVTNIDQPEAMLVSPDQGFFLRENLKLRLLNARLALLSRQFDQAQTDLQQAHVALDRYFDRSSRRVVMAQDLVQQVAAQSRQVQLPRPDETLAALAAANAGR
ncbi:MAG: hypothetical protein CFE46_05510 [Burkholderiales bacterium PBB6]|nr:MAG: hypothetical protein CFE46_05510 [Burkholderiales bacterium PBB6]